MRKGTAIVGATLLFGPQSGEPDLLLAMQFLLDDLRADGRRVAALKLTSSTLRLRSDPYELLLTVAPGPLPASSMQGLLRPPEGDTPDFARVHLARTLKTHSHAMGFLVRRRGAPILDVDEAMLSLAREGRLCLLPIIEALPPSLLIWQPGGLVLTTDEFRRADPMLLLQPGDPSMPLSAPPLERLALPRPIGYSAAVPAVFAPHASPGSRAEREEGRSLGRLFGGNTGRAHALPRLERSSDRLSAALRDADPRLDRAGSFWSAFFPQLGGQA